ncbi:exodeoxyribonuclease III [Flavobacteriales bacterium]|nr:exodeoxyribonuclease III [Flavobacteriales bacterium]
MKLGTWNVNGLRAVVKKDFEGWLEASGLDVLGLQETKAQDDQVREALFGLSGKWHVHSSSAIKKGYSGTAILSREEPQSVTHGIGVEGMDDEGRVTTADFGSFCFVTVYTPNSSSGLKRLPFRMEWDRAFSKYLSELAKEKPVICCGDLNVAHQPLDLARPKPNYNKTPGYTQDEIDGMTSLLSAGFTDVWRRQNPDRQQYSWWSYRGGAREKNVGWRLDYFLASNQAMPQCGEAEIWVDVHGSDHCPVVLDYHPEQ